MTNSGRKGRRDLWRNIGLLMLVGAWVVGLLFMVRAALDRISPPPQGVRQGECRPVELTGERQVGQAFTASLPGLHRIQVSMVPTAGHSLPPIVLHLKADPGAPDLWAGPLVSLPKGGNQLAVEFPPLRDSQDRTYFFSLEVPGGEHQPGAAACYSPGSGAAPAHAGDERLPGSLQFLAFYSLRTREKAALLGETLAHGRPYLFGTIGLYLGLMLVYTAIVGFLVVQLARMITMAGREGR